MKAGRHLALATAVAGLALAAAACPLVQPLPGVSQPADGGTLTPPRIAAETAHPVPAVQGYETQEVGCDGGPARFLVSAGVKDENSDDVVEARWFVDYDPRLPSRSEPVGEPSVSPAQEPGIFDRSILPLDFYDPASWPAADPAQPMHVVELVISNGFDHASDNPSAALPWRTPLPGYETQVFRWVFVPAPGSGADGGSGCGP